MKKSINKYKLIIITLIVTLLLVTLGVSYSIFNYVKQGEKESSITTGNITFIYTENENVGNGIVLTDAFPMSDEEGKSLTGSGNVFDFKVQANLSKSDIEYEIIAEPTSESTLPLDVIKLYLTEINDDTETEIDSSINLDSSVKTLEDYSDTTIENATGKTIYQETILRNTKGYVKNFRARMWLNDSIEFDENYINKSGSIRITVYANSDRSLASSNTTNPSDVSIERITANNKYLFTETSNTDYQYELTVPSEVDTLSIDVFPSNTDATYTVEQIQEISALNLTETYTITKGDNYFKVTVISSDTKSSKDYILKVTREESNNTNLNSLIVENYELTPTYSNSVNEYSLIVPSSVTSINIIATKTEDTQTVTGTGTIELTSDLNEISITVTAENGSKRVITITVTKEMNSDASISNVGITGYTLNHYQDNIYYIEVPYEVDSITINNISTTNATVTGIGEKINLQVGNNDYQVTVTSEDQTNSNDYIIRVIRVADTDNTLKSLSLTNCEIEFNSEITEYTCTVENSVTSTTVIAEATSSVATLTGIGEYNLNVGTNTIEIVVKAQDTSIKTYTVTIIREASSDATLKSLEIEDQTITPAFDKDTLSYTLEVPYSVDSITINAEATSSTAEITGIGSKTLDLGENTFTITVTAEDETTRSYVIIVTRLEDTDTSLKSISVENYNIVKVDENHYTLTVDNDVTSVVVNAEATSSTAEITSGTGTKTLEVGDNTIYVIVTSPSGNTEVYEIVITRLPSSDNTLKSLSVSDYTISPIFESTTTAYTLTVPYSVTNLTVNAEVNNSEASFEITGNTNLEVGTNEINVVVTAGDKTTKTYTITVTRSKDTTATLDSLSLTNCDLDFNSSTTEYTCTVENSITSTTVSATATSSVATVSGTGDYNLSVGTNTINVVVTAQDDTTKQTYTVTVTRKASSDATLKSLSIDDYTISPTFASGTTEYTLTVPYSVTNLTINAETNNDEASYIVSGNTDLEVGNNEVNIVVTAGDTTTKTYTITVTREKDSTSTLKSLSVSGYSLTPTFSEDTLEYSVTLEETSIEIIAETTSNVATVIGTGTKTLSWGTNTFNVIVTAQDGTTKTYILTVTNSQPVAPVLTGGTGSDTWTNETTTISVATAGSAISNVDYYEYYLATDTTTPSDSTEATGTTSDTVTISEEGTTYIYYRTVSTKGNKSEWSSPQVVNLDTTGPEVTYYTTSISTISFVLVPTISDELSGKAASNTTTVKYSDTEGVYTTSVSSSGGVYSFKSLSAETTYYYQLCAYDLAGNKTCITDSETTLSLGNPTITFTNTPSTAQNGYLLKQTAKISYSGNSPQYYYVKTTRAATSSVSTTYSCGTDTVPGTCSSVSSRTSLSANTWYRFTNSPTITYSETATSTDIIYAAIGSGTKITDTTSGTVSMIDATQPYITLTSASFSYPTYSQQQAYVYYDLGDDHSGVGTYTCEFTGSSGSVSSSSSGTSTSISSSGNSELSGTSISTNSCGTTSAHSTYIPRGTYNYVGYKICVTDKVGNETKCITGTISLE